MTLRQPEAALVLFRRSDRRKKVGRRLHALAGSKAHGPRDGRRDKARDLLIHRMGRRQGIVHPAQVCRHGRLAREHAVKQRAQAIDIGVFSVKFRHGVLLRRSITVEHLALQLAVRGAQAQRGIARKLGRARFGDEHRLGADAPVQQAHAVHGLHAIDHRAQQQKRLALRQRLGPLLQISEQRLSA